VKEGLLAASLAGRSFRPGFEGRAMAERRGHLPCSVALGGRLPDGSRLGSRCSDDLERFGSGWPGHGPAADPSRCYFEEDLLGPSRGPDGSAHETRTQT